MHIVSRQIASTLIVCKIYTTLDQSFKHCTRASNMCFNDQVLWYPEGENTFGLKSVMQITTETCLKSLYMDLSLVNHYSVHLYFIIRTDYSFVA